jgi:ATPase subunit of ABC transporter with duplicated ATPase domains
MRALEEGILGYAGCVCVISHDRWFLDRIATHILAFEGESSCFFFEGNFTEYEENKKKRLGEDSVIPHRIKYRRFSRD